MIKYIKASSDDTRLEKYFQDFINDASNCGYKMTVSGKSGDAPKILMVSDDKNLPRITVTTIDAGGGDYEFSVKAVFPDLDSDDLTYTDDIYSIMKDWTKVGSFIDDLLSYTFNESNFED